MKRDIDEYDPIKKYQYLSKNCEEMILNINNISAKISICELVLVALKAFDDVIIKAVNRDYHYYVQDDLSIYNFLNLTLNFDKLDKLKEALIILDESKLIYRFTVAQKFNVSDLKIKQIRINSWGRSFVNLYCMDKNSVTYTTLYNSFFNCYVDNKKSYDKLFELLIGKIDIYISRQIQHINSDLSIKLLS